MTTTYPEKVRHLHVIFGDQLDLKSAALAKLDADADAILMLEVQEEASYIPQHKIRLVLFFSAMRHFRDALLDAGYRVHYVELEDDNNRGSFSEELKRWINKTRPEKVIVTQPGDWRVYEKVRKAAGSLDCALEILEDQHFISDQDEFAEYAAERKSLLLENFYRQLRRKHSVLMQDSKPVGGQWNFDKDNRQSFGSDKPDAIKSPRAFSHDEITTEVIAMVERHFADSPGTLENFDYPVTHEQARAALRDFIEHRLPNFGNFQDAMVTGHPYLYHSRLSCVLNLHLLNPRAAIKAAVSAYEDNEAPINAVEGFVRQIIGWREYVRGIYWLKMPSYAELNELNAELPVPEFMWTGETEMNCVRHSVGQLIEHAYAHHIQRLMVLGLYLMLLGVRPQEVHAWHMSMYADAIDWVSLPNVLGMSQYGDGGIVGSKPYAASGNYISRMSNYCDDCRYNPKKAVGEDACPFTTLYWDFLSRNRQRIEANGRMGLQIKNLDRKSSSDRRSIRKQADKLKNNLVANTYL